MCGDMLMTQYRVTHYIIKENGKFSKNRSETRLIKTKAEAQRTADQFNKDYPGINARVKKVGIR